MVDWDSASDHSSFGVVHAPLMVRTDECGTKLLLQSLWFGQANPMNPLPFLAASIAI
jgi:hypothetical protein